MKTVLILAGIKQALKAEGCDGWRKQFLCTFVHIASVRVNTVIRDSFHFTCPRECTNGILGLLTTYIMFWTHETLMDLLFFCFPVLTQIMIGKQSLM